MSSRHSSKKQSFAPYAALIIVAVVLVGIANGATLYYASILSEQRADLEHSEILNATNEGTRINSLYHGQLMWLIGNNTKTIQNNTARLNSLIDAHNQLVKAIENQTGKPNIHNTYNIHKTYCTINQIYVPKECKHLIK